MENKKNIKEEILNRELRKQVERNVLLELQIALQKKLDPVEVSAKKPLRRNESGQVISWQAITRKEHIEMLEKELEEVDLVLKTIENQFK